MCYLAKISKKQAKSVIYSIFHDYGSIWLRGSEHKNQRSKKTVDESLETIAQNPDEAARSLIFLGAFGCGKSTCARILVGAFLEVLFLSTS